ncbi:STAS domain-containing protein [Streptomyces sp. NPDC039022]|uniref:STAS domain-containing protein n=1 Tax=unclassified Streptomyces TaxID=2593676 RepID=UPI0033FE6A5A
MLRRAQGVPGSLVGVRWAMSWARPTADLEGPMRGSSPLTASLLRLPLIEPPDLRLTVSARRAAGGATELGVAGELDVRTVRLLCEATVAHLKSGHRRLRLDLSGITWCDNASLYTLLGIRGAVQAAQGSLELAVASETVEQALVRTGVGPRLTPCPGTSSCRMTAHHPAGKQLPRPDGPRPHRTFWRGSCGDLLCWEPKGPGPGAPSTA